MDFRIIGQKGKAAGKSEICTPLDKHECCIKLFGSRPIHLSRSHLTPFIIHLVCLVLLQAEEQTCPDSAPAPGAALLQVQPGKTKKHNIEYTYPKQPPWKWSMCLWKLHRDLSNAMHKKTGYVLTSVGWVGKIRSVTFSDRHVLWTVHFRAILVSSVGVITSFCVSVPTRPGVNTLGWGQSSLRFDRKQTICSCYLAWCPSTLACFHRVQFLSRCHVLFLCCTLWDPAFSCLAACVVPAHLSSSMKWLPTIVDVRTIVAGSWCSIDSIDVENSVQDKHKYIVYHIFLHGMFSQGPGLSWTVWFAQAGANRTGKDTAAANSVTRLFFVTAFLLPRFSDVVAHVLDFS